MATQIRNSDQVDLLRPDFFARYEPNAAMVHAGLHLQLPQLRGYWPMSSVDENGAVYDLSGQGRTLTNANATPFAWYNLLPYADFTPGSTQYLHRADESGLDITGAITLGGWFYLDTLAPGNNFGLITKYTAAGNQRAYILYFNDATNQFGFNVSSDGTAGGTVIVLSTATLAVSTWYHVVGRYTPSTLLSVYVDGVATTNAVAIPAAISNSNASIMIGSYDAGAYLLDGRACQCFLCADDLDDVLIWTLYEQTRANYGK